MSTRDETLFDTSEITVSMGPQHPSTHGVLQVKLKLDGERHWLRVDELNRFAWPGYDLRPIPGTKGDYAYGMLPRSIFDALREKILSRRQAKKGGSSVDRD